MDRELLILLAFVYLAASQSCPEYAMPFGGQCYFYNATRVNMLSAQDTCWFSNYKLVEINSAEENNFVQNTIENLPAVWIGTARVTYWRTMSTSQDVQYVNWEPEIDFSNISENCALFFDNGFWKSVDCESNYQAHAMCKSAPGQNCPDGGTSFEGKCYIQSSETMTMESGDEFCRKIGYNLVEINNDEEDQFLQKIILDRGGTAFWMGIKRHFVWTTISTNEELTYTNWASSFPVNEYKASCAIITSQGDWRNVDCYLQDQASSMCQSRFDQECPPNGVLFQRRCYLLNNTTMDIVQAKTDCELGGFDLVGVDTPEENYFLLDCIKRAKMPGGWIGLMWFTSWALLPDLVVPHYTNWAAGYPSDNINERCVYMDDTGLWKNILCTNTTQAVMMCKKSQ